MNGIVGKVPTQADIISDACEDLVRAFFTATTKDSGSAEDHVTNVSLLGITGLILAGGWGEYQT